MNIPRMKLLIKIPSRSRPGALRACLESLAMFSTSLPPIIVSLDPTDDKAGEYRSMLDELSWGNLRAYWTRHRSKVHAFNLHIPVAGWDVLAVVSDDMRAIEPGYDQRICDDMSAYFPETDGILHYNDGHRGEELMSITVIGKAWYDRFLYVYHPDYRSLFCDNEMMEVGKALGKYRYLPDCLIEHLHPYFTGAPMDEQLKTTEGYYGRDGRIFELRRKLKFLLDKDLSK
jgi:hypothetical protein